MFHLLAYKATLGVASTNANLTPITDDVIVKLTDGFQPQEDYQLILATIMEATLTQGRIVTPSFRQVTLPIIRPFIDSAIPASLDQVADYRDVPLTLREMETVQVQGSSTSGGAFS